jgi:hypothetical protein
MFVLNLKLVKVMSYNDTSWLQYQIFIKFQWFWIFLLDILWDLVNLTENVVNVQIIVYITTSCEKAISSHCNFQKTAIEL